MEKLQMMKEALVRGGVSPEKVASMSEKQLEAACKERNIQIQSGLNNNANWGNVGDGFVRETASMGRETYTMPSPVQNTKADEPEPSTLPQGASPRSGAFDSPEIMRIYKDDGSFYDEISPRDLNFGRTYVGYDSDGKLKSVSTTVIRDGVECPLYKVYYDTDGNEIRRIRTEYDEKGNPVPIEEEVTSKTADTVIDELYKDKTIIDPKSENVNVNEVHNVNSGINDGNLTPEKIKESREIGANVAKRLLGITTQAEEEVIKLNMEKITADNVLEFLRGYEEARGREIDSSGDRKSGFLIGMLNDTFKKARGDAFFEQLLTEWNPEKQDLMRNTTEALKDFTASRYGKDSPIVKELEVILLEEEFGTKEAKKLDKLVTQLLTENMN